MQQAAELRRSDESDSAERSLELQQTPTGYDTRDATTTLTDEGGSQSRESSKTRRKQKAENELDTAMQDMLAKLHPRSHLAR
jgi:hypothetical protein